MAIIKDINGVNRRVPELGNSGWGTYTTQMLTALIDASLFTGSGDTKPLVADLDLGDNYGVIAAYIKSNSSSLPTTGKLRLANGDIISWRNAANDANIEVKIDSSNRFVIGGVNVPTISSSDALTNKTIDADNNTISNLEVDNLKAGVLDTDLSDAALTDTTIPSAKATKAYVDAVDTLIDNHIIDTTAAHAASAISSVASGNLVATDVQAALNELQSDIDTRATAQSVTDHLNDTTAAHAASAISNTPSGNLAATDVQAALNELQSDVDSRILSSYLDTDGTLAANSDTKIATQKAVKTFVAANAGSGGGSGQGKKNYIQNPSAAVTETSNWTAANFTVTRDTSTAIPRETTTGSAFKLVSTAGSSTATFLSDYRLLDDADLSKKLGIELAINVADSSNWTIDVLNSATSGGTYTRIPLPTDVSSITYLPATTGVFKSSVDMDASKPYIKFKITSVATAKTAYFSDIVVTPDSNSVVGPVVGPWVSFTPSSYNGFGAASTDGISYQRIGSSMRVFGRILVGTSTGVEAQLGLPSGYTTDATPSAGTAQICGRWSRNEASATARKAGTIITVSGRTYVTFGSDDYTSANLPATALNGSSFVSGQLLYVDFTVPIAEWAGSGTVNLAQNDVEFAYNTGTWDGNDTSSFGYGPSGGTMAGALTTFRSKTVRFQTPIQQTDTIQLEVRESSTSQWFPSHLFISAVGSLQIITANDATGSLFSGVNIKASSSTDIIVLFSRYAGAASDGSPAYDWVNGWQWRVRKTSAGAAIGFSEVVPGTSAGLVSMNGLKGNTTGNVIAAGYVGEVKSTAISSAVATWSGGTAASSISSISLTSGNWLLLGTATGYIENVPGGTSAAIGCDIYNSTDAAIINSVDFLGTVSNTAVTGDAVNVGLPIATTVSISSTKTVQFRIRIAAAGGSPTNATATSRASQGYFYAIRLS